MRRVDARTERRMGEAIARRERGLSRREAVGSAAFALAFAAAALAFAALAEPARALSVPTAAAFVLAFAFTARVEFASGSGYAVPTQLLVGPMLLLLPTTLAPLLIALGLVLASVGDALRGRRVLGRAPLALADAWFSLGPAGVLL